MTSSTGSPAARGAVQYLSVAVCAALAWLRARNLVRFELGTVVGLHAVGALFLALWPRDQLETPSTAWIFYFIPPTVWAAVFAGTAAVTGWCWLRPGSSARQLATWLPVFMVGTYWIAGFIAAYLAVEGNPLFGLAWAVVLLLWTSTAIRLARRPEAQCGSTT